MERASSVPSCAGSCFFAPFRFPVPGALLAAGEHRFPLAIDVPSWLPPGLSGEHCAIEHEVAVRVHVDWAFDPKARVMPKVHLAPRRGVRTPVNARSPDGFSAAEIRFADHHLGLHFTLPIDEADGMVRIARLAYARATAIAGAIPQLPFPAAIAHVDLGIASLPEAARIELESDTPTDRLRGVRASFSSVHVLGDDHGVTLERETWCADPRTLLPAIETFFAWVLEAHGEQRSDLSYR